MPSCMWVCVYIHVDAYVYMYLYLNALPRWTATMAARVCGTTVEASEGISMLSWCVGNNDAKEWHLASLEFYQHTYNYLSLSTMC